MKFIPYTGKIVIEPFKKEKVIQNEEKDLIESGRVTAIGENVEFVKVGDIVFFDSWGCFKVTDTEGVEYYVIPNTYDVILGKYAQE